MPFNTCDQLLFPATSPDATHSSLAQAITTPAMAVSHIMLESYKKYILVSLILLGKVQQLPKYTSQIVGRFIKVSFKNKMDFLTFFINLYVKIL